MKGQRQGHWKASGAEVLRENMSFEAQKIFATRTFDADVCVYFMTRRACFGWLSICSPRLSLFMPGSGTLLELGFGGQGLLKGPVSFGTFRNRIGVCGSHGFCVI